MVDIPRRWKWPGNRIRVCRILAFTLDLCAVMVITRIFAFTVRHVLDGCPMMPLPAWASAE